MVQGRRGTPSDAETSCPFLFELLFERLNNMSGKSLVLDLAVQVWVEALNRED